MRLRRERFGETGDGATVDRFLLECDTGLAVQLSALGAAVTRVRAPDGRGRPGDVALGFDELGAYLGPHPHLGSTVGRCANRIAHGRFPLEGRVVQLERNLGRHHLHGGARGFHAVVWEAETRTAPGEVSVRFRHRSRDGEGGYPGELDASVEYGLTAGGELRIAFRATSDRTTIVNLAHHSYFNLADGGASDVLDHTLEVAAERYTPVDADLLPTGAVAPVAGTPLDFRRPTPIGARIAELADGPGGYDHNYALGPGHGTLAFAARVREPRSGRQLEVWTTQPGLQLYTGNSLDGRWLGRGGLPYRRHAGLCLETQHYPDAPNHPQFPSIALEPGAVYAERVEYRFSAG